MCHARYGQTAIICVLVRTVPLTVLASCIFLF